jgi:hypothetical protein
MSSNTENIDVVPAVVSDKQQTRPRRRRADVNFTARVPVTADYVGTVVGSGGKTLSKIKAETGTRINVLQPQPGKGHLVHCFWIKGNSRESVERAESWILNIISNTYRHDHPDEFADEKKEHSDEN